MAAIDRREFLRQSGAGLGAAALASLLNRDGLLRANQIGPQRPLAPRPAHFAPRARAVIYLFMHGGPSHVDLFDPKPELISHAGEPLPESIGPVMTRRKVAQQPTAGPGSPLSPAWRSGLEISDFLPHLAEVADELCVLRGCHGDSVNHPQSVYQMNTGSILMGRPSLGSWVAMVWEPKMTACRRSSFCPTRAAESKAGRPPGATAICRRRYQGTPFRIWPTPVVDLHPQRHDQRRTAASTLDFVQALNRRHSDERQRRQRARSADRIVRAGVSHAGRGPGGS